MTMQNEVLFSDLQEDDPQVENSLYQTLVPVESLTGQSSWNASGDLDEGLESDNTFEPHEDESVIATIQPTASKIKKNNSRSSFKCRLCEREFKNARGLGGHMSRQHQGHSEKHAFKKAKRQERESHRLAVKLANKLLSQYDCSELSKAKVDRVRWLLAKAFKNEDDFIKLSGEESVFQTENETTFLSAQIDKLSSSDNNNKYLRDAITRLKAQQIS